VSGVADSLSWPFQDPGWFSKIVVQGLIAIIPIVGWISLAGWLMLTIDNYRAGRRELPRAGFHLERGIAYFVVALVWGIVLHIPQFILLAASGRNGGLLALAQLFNFAGSIATILVTPALVLATYRAGFAGGFDIGGIWQMLMANPGNTLLAAVMIFVANFIGGLGVIACCIGLIVTIPYSIAVTAGIVTWFEQASGPSAAPPYAAPPPPPPAAPA
jgi:hypothetical protein